MKTWKIAMAFGLGLSLATIPAQSVAALKQGAKAPDFTLNAAQGGKPFTLSLKQTLRNGPVVLYFFPAAFTAGCTIEAHLFDEANSRFNQLGARVIGSEEHTSELQSLMRISYAVFCLKKKK